jgi:prolipoprotein diacylglyceryltransferase
MFQSPGAIAVHVGPIAVRWYGVLMATAMALGLWLAHRDARRRGLDQLVPDGVSGPGAVLSLVVMSALSLASALVRRRRMRAMARIEARLSRYVGARSAEP